MPYIKHAPEREEAMPANNLCNVAGVAAREALLLHTVTPNPERPVWRVLFACGVRGTLP
jgi:hypothetical protein